MKKVLILVNHEIVIYNFRLELVEKLIEEGYEVILSSPKGEKITSLIKMGCKHVETKISRHSTNPIKDIKLLIHYIKVIKKYRPDVVLTYTIKPNVYGGISCLFTKTPYVANITGLGSAVENEGTLQKITILLYKLAFKKINMIFFQNEENRDFFKRYNLASDNEKLLPGSGVNLKHFMPIPYPDDKDGISFVFISRIMKEKGIDHYLEAARIIKEKYNNVNFHICGFCEEAYEEKLKEFEQKGIVIYHGMVSDIRNILEKTHCTIHPSYYPEGISNVLLESAACGRPIITTDRSGCREVVDHNVNGFKIQTKDTKDLIFHIEKFLALTKNERKTMGEFSRKKVESSFNRDIVVEEYLNVIESIVK